VDTAIDDADGKRNVVIRPTDSPLGRSRLRLGLELASDFSDGNDFSLSMMHVASSLNSYDAELRTVARVGSQRAFGMQWWQPLAPGSPWYVAPSLDYGATAVNLFSEGRRTARAGLRYADVTLAMGRQFGNAGDLAVGVVRRISHSNLLVPEVPDAPTYAYYETGYYTAFTIDTLDSVAFPSRGYLLSGQVARSRAAAGNEQPLTQAGIIGMAAFGKGAWAGHVYGEWSRANLGTAPQSLGGFLRLSGTMQNSLDGQTVAFGRLVAARRVGELVAPLGGAVRLGFSLEAGGGFRTRQQIRGPDLKEAASVFVSADTRFGPLYLGTGATRGTGGTLYLFLGPIW
jgi:NTE family protein